MKAMRHDGFPVITSIRVLTALILWSTVASGFASTPPTGLRVQGKQILTPEGKPLKLRGFNICWWIPPTLDDATNMKAMHVNCVRYMFGYAPEGKFNPERLSYLVKQVRYFTKRGIWVIPVLHDFRKEGKGPYDSEELNLEFLDLWAYVIGKLGDDPYMAAWEPINEPHDSPAVTVSGWYKRIIPRFRQLDPSRPLVVEGTGYSWPQNLDDSIKQPTGNIIYAFHTYGPWDYTSQSKDANIPYPGKWSRSDLAQALAPAMLFREKYKVPVWCGEFGVPTFCPGYQQWIKNVSSILEEDNFSWTYWAWGLKSKTPLEPSFDVNPRKKPVFDLMTDLFRDLTR